MRREECASIWKIIRLVMNHSTSISEREKELEFVIHELPNTTLIWDGGFSKVCARILGPSSYIMKFEGNSGPEYHQFKWGAIKEFPKMSPRWVPIGCTFTDPEMAIHVATLDMRESFELTIALHPIPPRPIDSD